MSETYYAQSNPCPTLTVGQLIEKLKQFDPGAKVIFRSPQFGAFGSNTAYSLDGVEFVSMEQREEHCGPQYDEDEDTGEMMLTAEDYVHVFEAWEGVVIT